ncbi:MAG: hypothetical protein IPO14_09820 [Saprospiraceae bacterium]|nr:hypothetical protein [Saprospiraceae bacterium]
MADTYRNYLINGIREFDLLRNPPIIRTNQYYSDLTWFGIRSDAGQIYDNLSQSEKDRIQNLINIENFAGGCN